MRAFGENCLLEWVVFDGKGGNKGMLRGNLIQLRPVRRHDLDELYSRHTVPGVGCIMKILRVSITGLVFLLLAIYHADG